MVNISNNSNISTKRSDQASARICFLSIDIEKRQEDGSFEGVEQLDKMLDIFKKHNVNATLFITGEVLEKYSGLIKKWAEDFEIGCHNYTHIPLDKFDSLERERQIKDFIRLYQKIFNKKLKGFRAPRNIIDNKQFPILEAYGFLYDSSVFPRYPWPVQVYEGYKGRAPIFPYYPSKNNYRKKGDIHPVKSRKAGSPKATFNRVKILEIPETPITFLGLPLLNVPLVATWLRKWGVKIFKTIFFFRKPKFISFNMHSWDAIKFFGKSSKNSGEKYISQLDKILGFLKKIGYEFKSGEQIYEEFSKNR